MKITSQRLYCLLGGFLLFFFGILGFAFPTAFEVGGAYLFAAIVLGFWGITAGFAKQ